MEGLSEHSNSLLFVLILTTLAGAMIIFPINAYRLSSLIPARPRVNRVLSIGAGIFTAFALHLGARATSLHFAQLLGPILADRIGAKGYLQLGYMPMIISFCIFAADLYIARRRPTP